MKKTLGLIALLLVAFSPAHARMTDAEIVEDLRAHVDELVAEDRFSGAVKLTKNGKVLFEGAYGYADLGLRVPNTIDTKFNMASMGKMFTGVSILQLVQAGKLSLDTKLINVFPDFPNKEAAAKATIFHLLTHTSGMGDFFGAEFERVNKEHLDSLEDLLPLYGSKPLAFEPGTSWAYSNGAFITLGLVIEKISGESYYDYVAKNILKPAGMTNTGFWAGDEVVPNRANVYTTFGSKTGARRSNIYGTLRGGSAGGGYSNVSDMQRFSKALQGRKLLNKTYTDMIMTGKVDAPQAIYPGGRYGFGMVESILVPGARFVGHTGTGTGANVTTDMYPELGYVTTIMSNYDGGMMLVNDRLRLALAGVDLPKPIDMSADTLSSFVGSYTADAAKSGPSTGNAKVAPDLQITADAEGLWIDYGAGPKRRFLPSAAMQFFDRDDPGATIAFQRDVNGQVSSLKTEGVRVFTRTGLWGGPILATRRPEAPRNSGHSSSKSERAFPARGPSPR